MAFQEIKNVAIRGMTACVPAYREENIDLKLFGSKEEAEKFIEATGVRTRHLVKDSGLCASDLCYHAAEELLEGLQWDKDDVDCLVFVSQTPDYILPATSCILQNRLGLSIDCYALDISLGCSGWVYGLSVIASLVSQGTMKKGLFLVGDTTSVTKSPKDKSTYPLFGDAGTATALEFDTDMQSMKFHFGTDGKGSDAIKIPDGGFRNFYNKDSFSEEEFEPGIIRHKLHSILNGPAVFTFGITKAPKSVKALLEEYNLDPDNIDYFIFHQANLFMNEKIRKKLKIDEAKVPYCMDEYGNTSSASVPLAIVSRLSKQISNGVYDMVACAFGVGLSWATVSFRTEDVYCPEIIEV